MARRPTSTPKHGWVYIASNPSIPGLLKVGATVVGLEQRMKNLEKTSIPTPFRIEATYESEDVFLLENSVHIALDIFRLSESKEYFELGSKAAKLIIDRLVSESGGVSQMLSHSFVNNPSLSKIGDIVRAQRKILGLTQDELAKRCNLSHATIEALENDRIHELGCTKLFKITKTLGLTLGLSEPEINPMEKQ